MSLKLALTKKKAFLAGDRKIIANSALGAGASLGTVSKKKLMEFSINPISPGVLDPGNTQGGGHKVPGFNLRALNCCFTLKLCICFQKYKLSSHEKKIV